MGQVAAGREAEAHEGVARIEQREEHCLVHLAAAVGLDVGVFAAEQLLGTLDRQVLGDVDILAAAVIALARIALGILVREYRALRGEHRRRGEVLAGYQLDGGTLAV